MYIFVYGTLMQGYGNWNRYLRDRSQLITNGTLRGYKLFDSGFPVASISPDDCVYGQVFLIDAGREPSVVRDLDFLEGYHKDYHDGSMYHRIPVSIFGDDGTQYECETYRGNLRFWNNFEGMRDVSRDAENRYHWSR